MLLVQLHEIDRIDEKRREATFTGDLGHDAAGKREEKARALDQKQRFELVLRHVLQLEETGIVEFADEEDRSVGNGLGREFQRDFEDAVAVRVGAAPTSMPRSILGWV